MQEEEIPLTGLTVSLEHFPLAEPNGRPGRGEVWVVVPAPPQKQCRGWFGAETIIHRLSFPI